MDPFIDKKFEFGCCNCSREIVEGELVWCSCCQRIYCMQCFSTLQVYVALLGTKVDEALGHDREKTCLKEYFTAVEDVILAEALARMPVPHRSEGH